MSNKKNLVIDNLGARLYRHAGNAGPGRAAPNLAAQLLLFLKVDGKWSPAQGTKKGPLH